MAPLRALAAAFGVAAVCLLAVTRYAPRGVPLHLREPRRSGALGRRLEDSAAASPNENATRPSNASSANNLTLSAQHRNDSAALNLSLSSLNRSVVPQAVEMLASAQPALLEAALFADSDETGYFDRTISLAPLNGSISAVIDQVSAMAGTAAAGCPVVSFDPSRTRSGAANCFCQLVQNPTCASSGCDCGMTCDGPVNNEYAVTAFLNQRRASGCGRNEAVLTVPKSYFRDIGQLMRSCEDPTQLLAQMLQQGFRSYRNWVQGGAVKQCIHAAGHISVPWLHLHTFCDSGHVDGMPTSTRVALCETMHDEGDAYNIASKFVEWAQY